ncbi:MAG: hypothetical protein L3J58_07665 [Emcibacter sp.]|nr:hypothetical protein [Emcibacter sp.]
MKKGILFSIAIIIFFGSLVSAHAETPLNGKDIQHFMNAMKPLQKLGEKYNIDEDDNMPMEQGDMNSFSPMTSSLEKIRTHEAFDEFKSIIFDAGFSSVEQWANVGDRIMRAFMSLKMTSEITPEIRQQIQKSLAEIKKSDYLSPEVKQQLITSMNHSLALGKNMSPDDKADIDTVKPYLAKLERHFEETE